MQLKDKEAFITGAASGIGLEIAAVFAHAGANDEEFTTTDDVAQVALFFASFPSKALTDQSLVVSHGWFMQ